MAERDPPTHLEEKWDLLRGLITAASCQGSDALVPVKAQTMPPGYDRGDNPRRRNVGLAKLLMN